jgi:hypothetical protein
MASPVNRSPPYPTQQRIGRFIQAHDKPLTHVLMLADKRSFKSSTGTNWAFYICFSPDLKACEKLLDACHPELQKALGFTSRKSSNSEVIVEVDIMTYLRIYTEDNLINSDSEAGEWMKALLFVMAEDPNPNRLYARLYWSCLMMGRIDPSEFIYKIQKKLNIGEVKQIKEDIQNMKNIILSSTGSVPCEAQIIQGVLVKFLKGYPKSNFCLLVVRQDRTYKVTGFSIYCKTDQSGLILPKSGKEVIRHCTQELLDFLPGIGESTPYDGYITIGLGLRSMYKFKYMDQGQAGLDPQPIIDYLMRPQGNFTIMDYLYSVIQYLEFHQDAQFSPELLEKVLSLGTLNLGDMKQAEQESMVMKQLVKESIQKYDVVTDLELST